MEVNYKETHVSVKKLMKTRENGENIYKMPNAWLRNCRSILVFRGNKAYKERDQKENTWRVAEQFSIVFLSRKRDQAIL